jgi:hypothetical protein
MTCNVNVDQLYEEAKEEGILDLDLWPDWINERMAAAAVPIPQL